MEHSKNINDAVIGLTNESASQIAEKYSERLREYAPMSAIKLPLPTDEEIKNWVGENHPKEHYIAAWQLFQIQILLQDFAFAAPRGFKVRIEFKAHTEGDEVHIDKINAEYNRWLYG